MTINIEFAPKRKDGSRNIRLLITNGTGKGNRARIATNIYVKPSDIGYRTVKGKKTMVVKNERISAKLDTVIAEARENALRQDTVLKKNRSTKQIKSIIVGDNNLPTFFDFADHWLEAATIKGINDYRTAVKKFREYAGEDLRFDQIKYTLLKGFEDSLGDKRRAPSSYLGCIRHLWNEADMQYDELMPKTPFKRYKVPKQKMVGQRALSIENLLKVYNYQGSGRTQLARDCAVLSFCLMGLNSADLYNVSTIEDGVIKYNRTKTADRRQDGAYMEVKVPEFIAELVEKYRDKTGERVFNFHHRYKDLKALNRAINLGLKNIIENLQFYQFRHTWATVARNDIRANKEDINEALVHIDGNMAVTDLYIKKDFTIVNEINQKVIDYVFKETK